MEEKKRTILAVVISCTILAAVLYSFGVNFFRTTAEIVVADPSAQSSQDPDSEGHSGDESISVEVTPQTVQSIIAGMSRYKSYSRTLSIRYIWGEGESAELTARVVESGGWLRCDVTLPGGMAEHSVLGAGRLWYWYDEGPDWLCVAAHSRDPDLVQYIPTYEDILALNTGDITRTDFEEKLGVPCICVEADGEEGRIERWWVSASSGLLIAAEVEENGVVVYAMASGDVVSPAALGTADLTLPDGTYLPEGG